MSVELHHRLDGPADAPPLVLLNSLGTTNAMWDAQLPLLAERFRVVRCDNRGHGESPVPPGPYVVADLGGDLLALLDRLGIERASLCGVSLGGMVAMWTAEHAPERVDRVALCCTTARFHDRAAWDQRIADVRAGGMAAVADAVVERWLTPGFRASHPETAEWLRAMLCSTPPDGYAACCEAIRDLDVEERLGEIDAPTLVVAATDDPATPADHGRRIAEAIPSARLELIPNAAHLANIQRPEAFTPAILDHLAP